MMPLGTHTGMMSTLFYALVRLHLLHADYDIYRSPRWRTSTPGHSLSCLFLW